MLTKPSQETLTKTFKAVALGDLIGEPRVNKIIALLLALIMLASASSIIIKQASSDEATGDSWAIMTPMPTARAGLEVAVVDGKIYAIGGSNNGFSKANEMYDPAANNWTVKAQMPTARSGFGIAVYGKKIYCIGGAAGPNSEPTGVVEVYDTVTDSWETKTSMPTSRHGIDANLVNGEIYVIGGSKGSPVALNLNEVYDPESDTWTTKAAPVGVYNYASAVVDGTIYVIGGGGSDLTQIYTPDNDTWSQGALIPNAEYDATQCTAAAATAGVLAPKRIYVLGGGSLIAFDLNRVYDPVADAWSNATSMPTARETLAVAVVDDLLYAIGGSGWNPYKPPVATNERYTPIGYGSIPLDNSVSPGNPEPFLTTLIVGSVVAATVVGLSLLLYFKKRRG
jgi:N-acetylneuraminic acid mutarotase